MSLLCDAPHTVLVYVEEATTDGDGNPVKKPSQYPVKVQGRVQPMFATEYGVVGEKVGTRYKFLGQSFPGGGYAWVEWQGRTWDVEGEPQRFTGGSSSTSHVTVILRARRPEVTYG